MSGCSIIIFCFLCAGLTFALSSINALIQGYIPGLNLFNLGIFILAGLLFIPSFKQADRTVALVDLRRDGLSGSYVGSETFTFERKGSKRTWPAKTTRATASLLPVPTRAKRTVRKSLRP